MLCHDPRLQSITSQIHTQHVAILWEWEKDGRFGWKEFYLRVDFMLITLKLFITIIIIHCLPSIIVLRKKGNQNLQVILFKKKSKLLFRSVICSSYTTVYDQIHFLISNGLEIQCRHCDYCKWLLLVMAVLFFCVDCLQRWTEAYHQQTSCLIPACCAFLVFLFCCYCILAENMHVFMETKLSSLRNGLKLYFSRKVKFVAQVFLSELQNKRHKLSVYS